MVEEVLLCPSQYKFVYDHGFVPLASQPDYFNRVRIHELQTKAKFRRRTSHEPNRMQMRKILCSPSLAFDSAHVKYGV